MDERRRVLIQPYQQKFLSAPMLQREALGFTARFHQRMNKIQKKINNDAVDAMAYAMLMMQEPGCIVIKEEW